MTRDEMKVVMGILQDAYPRFYTGKDKFELTRALDLWSEMFKEHNAKVVVEAVKMLVMESPYPPVIADVKARIDILIKPQEVSGAEVWGKVLKAIGNSNYSSTVEFEKLPQEAQRIVREPSQLKQWALMDMETLNSVVSSNFLRQYAAIQKSDKQRENIPEHMKLGSGERKMLDA
jgi:hypothetical protein